MNYFKFFLLAISLIHLQAMAESLECKGQTVSDPVRRIEVSVDMDRGTSTLRHVLPDGSGVLQGIGLNQRKYESPKSVMYTYEGSTRVYLQVPVARSSRVSGIFTHAPQGLISVPMECEVFGDIPAGPSCPAAAQKDGALLKAMDVAEKVDDIEFLLKCGANPNVANTRGCTPLMMAVDPDCHPGYASGAINDTRALLDLLLSNGAFANTQDKKGETALSKSARNEVQGVYDLFIAAEADFDLKDKKGNTPLMYAALAGDKWIIQDVLEGNPDRRLKNNLGKTAYDIARTWHEQDVASLVRVPDQTITVAGQDDGTCSPLSIEVKQGQAVEFVLKGTDKMFKLVSRALNLDLMADRGQSTKQIVTLNQRGSYQFTCGFHGANTNSQGMIVVK